MPARILRPVECVDRGIAVGDCTTGVSWVRLPGLRGALGGLDYALFKFRRPLEYVSVDIDVLVRGGHVQEAVRRLARRGFRVEVLEPYTVTMVRGGAIVDLYTHPSFAWVVYLDGGRLLEEVETVELDGLGVEAPALTREAEVVVAAAHAVYKEHIYLLADYFVVREWLNGGALRLAEELRAGEAVHACLKLNRLIERGLVEAPVKLGPGQVMKILVEKFVEDPGFRATSLNMVKLALKRRAIEQLLRRLKRRTY